MSALSPAQQAVKDRQKVARSRASRIRIGTVGYLETLALIAAARAQDDHLTLGYKSWAEYVDGEYGAERLKLSPEMQQKAITELRLVGATQREIAHTLGVNQSNVSRALARDDADASPDEIYDRDGNIVPPARSDLVEAMTGAIEDAQERAENRADDTRETIEDLHGWDPDQQYTSTQDRSVDTPIEAEPERGVATEPGTAAEESEAREREPSADPEPDLPPSGSGSPNPERIEDVCPTCGKPRWTT